MKIEELFSVRGKVALVTGGSRGIGEMIARAYVENGARVYITARKAEACDALAKELSKSGECISIPGDISRIDEIDRLGVWLRICAVAKRRFGRRTHSHGSLCS